jgi:hypothetical protein
MMFAASTMLVSGVTEITDRVMIWWARMGELRRVQTNIDVRSLDQRRQLDLTQVKQDAKQGRL